VAEPGTEAANAGATPVSVTTRSAVIVRENWSMYERTRRPIVPSEGVLLKRAEPPRVG
jgi:hypothetical protein